MKSLTFSLMANPTSKSTARVAWMSMPYKIGMGEKNFLWGIFLNLVFIVFQLSILFHSRWGEKVEEGVRLHLNTRSVYRSSNYKRWRCGKPPLLSSWEKRRSFLSFRSGFSPRQWTIRKKISSILSNTYFDCCSCDVFASFPINRTSWIFAIKE